MKARNALALALVVCAMAGVGTLGCNTFRGVGKDIQKGGQAVENAADSAHSESRYSREGHFTITARAKSGGSITPSGSTTVPRGSSQTFIATANTGYRVANVLVDGRSVGALSDLYHDDSSSYTFDNVTAHHVISASFDVNERP